MLLQVLVVRARRASSVPKLPRTMRMVLFHMCPSKSTHHGNTPSPFAALDVHPHRGPILQNLALAVEGPSTLQPMALLWTIQGGRDPRRSAQVLPPPGNPPQLTEGLGGALSIRLHTRYVTDRESGRIEDADEQ